MTQETFDRRAVAAGLAGLSWAGGAAWAAQADGRDRPFGDQQPIVDAYLKAHGAELDLAAVRFPADAAAPDYCHLVQEAPRRDKSGDFAFTLSVQSLQRLFEANGFARADEAEIGKYRDDDHVLFALRGCRLANEADIGVLRQSVRLIDCRPDHRQARCVVGVLRPKGKGELAVFKASTVANVLGIAAQSRIGVVKAQDGRLVTPRVANLFPTGQYGYGIGRHGAQISGAFRLAVKNPKASKTDDRGEARSVYVLRNKFEASLGIGGTWDNCQPYNNIHPGITPIYDDYRETLTKAGVKFSSEGCITIYDDPKMLVAGTWGGPNWRRLRQLAGVTQNADFERYHTLRMLTGAEAALADNGRQPPRRLRIGSEGKAVKALWKELKDQGMTVGAQSPVFNPELFRAWLELQRRRLPSGTPPHSVVSRRRLEACGVTVSSDLGLA